LFVRRLTANQLAAEWGVSRGTMNAYVAEARRLTALDRGSLEELRDDQLAKLDMIIVAAIAKKEFRTAVQAIDTAARIAGTVAAKRHEVTANLLVSPLWVDLRWRILRALAPYPQARDAVLAALASAQAEARSADEVLDVDGEPTPAREATP
jgi:hypothetical protein